MNDVTELGITSIYSGGIRHMRKGVYCVDCCEELKVQEFLDPSISNEFYCQNWDCRKHGLKPQLVRVKREVTGK